MGAWEFAAVGSGAAAGAWLRWALGLRFNAILPTLPIGTLLANLLGGLLVGIALAWFERHPHVAPAWRLFAITGFLGGLTTFSTFSGEVTGLLLHGDYVWGLCVAAAHLCGSLLLTALGIGIVAWV